METGEDDNIKYFLKINHSEACRGIYGSSINQEIWNYIQRVNSFKLNASRQHHLHGLILIHYQLWDFLKYSLQMDIDNKT